MRRPKPSRPNTPCTNRTTLPKTAREQTTLSCPVPAVVRLGAHIRDFQHEGYEINGKWRGGARGTAPLSLSGAFPTISHTPRLHRRGKIASSDNYHPHVKNVRWGLETTQTYGHRLWRPHSCVCRLPTAFAKLSATPPECGGTRTHMDSLHRLGQSSANLSTSSASTYFATPARGMINRLPQ